MWILLAAAALASSSCSGTTLCSVHGQVFYEGKPADGAVVYFHPQKDQGPTGDAQDELNSMTDIPTAKVKADGSFELATYNRGRAAPPAATP